MALLALNNVEVVYDRVFLAVKGVSIEVPAAGLVALLGANGAGKSTILKAISGLLTPERGEVTRGEITFDGAQVLAIARALMTEPRLILLDEPSLGLAPFLVDEIFDIVRKINAETKVAVLLVEQNAAAALEIAHSAYLVENGRIVMNGTAEVLRANPDIDAAYLGGGYRTDYHAVKHYRRRRRWLA